ncbi:MAG: hypothetical protein H0V89_06840 [Deltaproteobacteria bacterium]|nr:hypothetical protein [Deltaproteobacteria bacterium]
MDAFRHGISFALIGFFAACGDPYTEGESGAPALEEAELGPAGRSKFLGGTNGDGDYCNHPSATCASGEGDCDYTYQCNAGLVCGVDNGDNFGFSLLTDVCVEVSCTNKIQDGTETGVDCGNAECGVTCPDPCQGVDPVNGGVNHCTDTCPCGPNEGDCDSDLQCEAGLDCATDVGANYGFTPLTDVCEGAFCANGILDGDETGIDCGGSCSPCEAISGWVERVGNAAANVTADIAVDVVDGSVYVAGQFTGTLDSGVGNLVSNGSLDFYVIKFDPAGNPVWARSYGGTAADGDGQIGLAVDPVTRQLAIGTNFQGTADFGGGSLTSASGYDAILVVLDSAGNYVAANRYGGVGFDRFEDVRWDRFGNLFAAASFLNSISFGGANLVTAGNFDVAAVKFSPALVHLWSARFGGTGLDTASGIAVDYDGRPVLVGTFTGTATFGATALTSLGLGDVFVLKLFGTNGAVSFAKGFGGLGADLGWAVDVDLARNNYIVGGFKRTVDFGGGPVVAVGVADKLDAYVVSLNSAGAFRWVRTTGGTDHDSFTGVAVDTVSSDLAVAGNFKLTLPGFDDSGADVVSAGGIDGVVATIDSATGNTQSVERYGTAGDDYAESVARDGASVELWGVFTNTMDVGGINVTSAGSTDAWAAHFVSF